MVGKKVSKIKEYKESSLGERNLDDLNEWTIVYSDNPMKFGTIILQRGEKIIVSFTGSAPIPGGGDGGIGAVSYTHLTLPTICSV